MYNAKYIHLVRSCLIVTLLTWPCRAQSLAAQAQPGLRSQLSAASDVGRGSPFASLLRPNPAEGRAVQQSAQTARAVGETPPLTLDVVTLTFLDAREIGVVFAPMCSEFGSISVLEKSNSIVVFDTKESLEKIIAELKKIDKAIPGLAVGMVTLKALDARTAKAALEKMASPNGNITVVDKGNCLIVCDAKPNLDAIIAEASQIDKPMQGLIVEPVALKFLDAKSAQAALAKMSSDFGSIATVERTNSLIVCDTRRNVDMIRAEVEKIDRPAAGLFVKVATLKFLEAKNMKTILDRMISQYGSVAVNEKTNSLIICDTRENLARMLAEIENADKTPPQIMVEVVILDVQLKDDTELGMNWDSDISIGAEYKQNFASGTEADSSIVTLTGSISNVIHVIQQKRDAQILASPRAMMLSGQSATIEAVEEIPYREVMDTAQGGAAALTSTQFKNVGVTLKVAATITDDNDIFLVVEAEHNVNTGTSDGGVPVVDTRKANTALLLKDGQIVIMGGLRREETIHETNKIPLLGDIPLLGWLFKNDNPVTSNSELIVLVSPHIHRGQRIPEETMAKYNYIRNKSLLGAAPGKH